jgi:hypothetical protein
MTDADAEADASEAAAAEQAGDDEDGQPEITDEEMADLDAVREQVAEATTADEDGEEDTDSDEQTNESTAEEPAPSTPTEEGDTVGDFYVDTLVSTSNMLISEHGREGADPIDGQPLRQMGVDDAVDELMAANGGPDMPPEQQVLLGTSMFGLFVLASKTTVLDDALENADFSLTA